MEAITKQQKKDIRLIRKFVEIYCAGKQHSAEQHLCPECATFLEYAIAKRLKCPLEAEKPTCKHCRVHCYDTLHREKMREIMSYAGRKLVMRGRLDYLWHYFS